MIGKMLLSLVASLVLLSSIASSYSYTLPTYVTNNTASPVSVYGLSLKSDESCSTTIRQYMTASGTGYGVETYFYSPDGNLLTTAILPPQNNISCKFLGDVSTTNSINDIFEGRTRTIIGGFPSNATLLSRYECSSVGNWLEFEIYPSSDADSYGNVPLRYVDHNYNNGAFLAKAANATADHFNNCYSALKPEIYANYNGGCTAAACSVDTFVTFYYPFNSTGGVVNYSIAKFNGTDPIIEWTENCAGLQSSINATLALVDWETGEIDILSTEAVAADNGGSIGDAGEYWEGSLYLEEDKLYFLVLWMMYDDFFHPGGCTSDSTTRDVPFNISIFTYRADWTCGDWSDCEEGSQTRTCYDPDGVALPKIEFRTCSLNIAENATLGFEEFVREDDIYMCIPQWNYFFSFCQYGINTTYRDTPANWTIVENPYLKRHFLGMSQDWSSEGSRSLKLWYIPPKMGEPIDNTTCGNQTIGTIPSVYQSTNNDTFGVLYNVTFPSADMIVSFDVKGCKEQEHQHWGLTNPIFFWDNQSYLCQPQCYAGDCDSVPLARYMFNIIDVNNSVSVLGTPYFGNANPNLMQTIQIDMSNLGLVAGNTYNLIFAVYPENLQDQRGDCVYIDNVQYYVLNEPFVNLIPDCQSRCIGSTFYEARILTNGDCSVIKMDFAPECLSSENAAHVEALEDYCDDTTTLAHYNERLAKYEFVSCDYSCIDSRCITEDEEQSALAQLTLYDPPPWLISIAASLVLVCHDYTLSNGMYVCAEPLHLGLTYTDWDVYGYSLLWFALSTFMLVNYLAIGLGLGVIVMSKTENTVHWEYGAVVTLIIIMSAFFAGMYPLEIGIVAIILIALSLYYLSGNKLVGHK